MEKKGLKPKGKIKIKWSTNFAYAVGLLVSDGNLSPDGRHITFTSKETEQIKNFMSCLSLKVKIGKTTSGHKRQNSFRVQFGDVIFYKFLESIGLCSNKSKIIGEIEISDKYFFDFLRGSFDGDGTFYSYWDPRWRSSHMFYLEFVSASPKHTNWLRKELNKKLNIKGHITKDKKGATIQLKYAKKEAIEIIKKMYYSRNIVCLSRKRKKIESVLKIEKKQQYLYTRAGGGI